MERFCFDTILKNVLKNRTHIIGLLISVICIIGFSMQVQAQARTRKAVPYMLPLMHRRRRQNAGLRPISMGITPFGNSISSTQDSIGMHLVGRWNVGYRTEPFYDFSSVSGNYAYVATDFYITTSGDYIYPSVHVIDISDPAAPKEVGHYNIVGDESDYITWLTAVGHYVYLNMNILLSPNHRTEELRILDMSDPGNPREVGSYDEHSIYEPVFSVSGNYAYICRDSTLHVIDMSDLASPHNVTSINVEDRASISDIDVTGGYAYVTTTRSEGFGSNTVIHRNLDIFDVNDPTKPIEVGSLSQADGQGSNGYGEVSVSGGLAFVACGEDSLRIFDVNDPTKPHEVGSYIPKFPVGFPGEVDKVFATGKYAYIIDYINDFGGDIPAIQILDVSDPSSPHLVGTYYDIEANSNYNFYPSELYVKDGYIYTIDEKQGLYILKSISSNELAGIIENVTLDKGTLPTSALSGSRVSVYSGSAVDTQATTGSDGSFQFPKQTDSSYTLRVSANAIDELTSQATNLSWDYTVKPTYYSIQFPVGLFNQTYTGAYGLNHLTISSDVLFGLLPPQPLLNSYDPTATGALLQDWRTGATAVSASDTNSVYTQRIRALARHLMVQSLYQGEFTNAATMSHSLSTATTQLITNYVLAGKLANKTEEKTSKEVSEVKLANEVNSLIQGIRGQVRSAFLSPVINKVANALPAPYNKYVPLAVGKTLAFFQSDSKKDFLTDMLKDQTQALASTASDEILLSYGYVPATQTGLDRSVKLAHAFDYSGSTGQAFHDLVDTTTSSVLEQSDAATKLVKNIADKATTAGDFTKKSATITQLIAEVAAPTSETGVGAVVAGVAESLTGVLKGTALASYLTSAIAPGLRLVQIASEANHGVDVAYHPDQQSTFQKILPEQSGRRYIRYTAQTLQTSQKDLTASVDQYNQLVQQILSLIQNNQKSQAMDKLSELMQADQSLDQQLQISQAPVDAVADQLAPSDSTFLAHYLSLAQANVGGAAARAGLYANLLGYALNQPVTSQDLSASADSVSKHLSDLENQTTAVTGEVSSVAAPPYVIISKDSLSASPVKSNIPFTLSAVVTNLGTSAATNVTVTLQTDSATTTGSQKQITITSLDVGAKKVISWTLTRTDTTSMGSYTINLSSDNAKVLPTTDTYFVENTGLATTGIQGSLQTRPNGYHLGQNYPNPFNPTTTIRYTLSGSRHVSLTVYNVLGQIVARLVDRTQTAGAYSVRFDAHDLPSGLYIYRLKAGTFTQTKKMMLIK